MKQFLNIKNSENLGDALSIVLSFIFIIFIIFSIMYCQVTLGVDQGAQKERA